MVAATIALLVSGGITTLLYLNGIRNDLSVVQRQQINDETTIKQMHDDQRDFSVEMRASLGKISDDLRSIVTGRDVGKR